MSQMMDILRYLQEGNTITPLEALDKFGCFRLSGRICDLRKLKYKVTTKMIYVPDRTGKMKQVAQYRLEE